MEIEVRQDLPAVDSAAALAARQRWDRLTKPLGSLGRLEELGVRLAGITGQVQPTIARKVIFTVAADHGVVEEGVSAYPQAVTAQMVLNFLRGGAGINVLARHVGAEVVVVDAGVAAADFEGQPGVVIRKIRRGTSNMVREPAMSRAEAQQILQMGAGLFEEMHRLKPIHLVGLGEMGIGNTTASAALTAVLTGSDVARVTGRGTGLTDEQLRRKIQVIEKALQRHQPVPEDPLGSLACVGGFEIGFLAGIILEAARARVPIVLDGFITTAAALVAQGFCPGVRDYLIASHCSVEPGHRIQLEHLGLEPLLDLQLRLGEGTGAALAFSLIEASIKLVSEMATFEEAGVSKKIG